LIDDNWPLIDTPNWLDLPHGHWPFSLDHIRSTS
jgi:hypothetical protein